MSEKNKQRKCIPWPTRPSGMVDRSFDVDGPHWSEMVDIWQSAIAACWCRCCCCNLRLAEWTGDHPLWWPLYKWSLARFVKLDCEATTTTVAMGTEVTWTAAKLVRTNRRSHGLEHFNVVIRWTLAEPTCFTDSAQWFSAVDHGILVALLVGKADVEAASDVATKRSVQTVTGTTQLVCSPAVEEVASLFLFLSFVWSASSKRRPLPSRKGRRLWVCVCVSSVEEAVRRGTRRWTGTEHKAASQSSASARVGRVSVRVNCGRHTCIHCCHCSPQLLLRLLCLCPLDPQTASPPVASSSSSLAPFAVAPSISTTSPPARESVPLIENREL